MLTTRATSCAVVEDYTNGMLKEECTINEVFPGVTLNEYIHAEFACKSAVPGIGVQGAIVSYSFASQGVCCFLSCK